MERTTPSISAPRLRVGVLLVALWWLPVWLLAPVIAEVWDLDSTNVWIAVIVVQTVLGLVGVLVAGRQVARIMQGVSRRQMIPTVWRVLRHGTLSTEPDDGGPAAQTPRGAARQRSD